MALHLTFGGAPGPYEWGVVLESICDLSIAIMQDEKWNPSHIQSPDGCHVPPPKILDESIPFAEGKDLIVDVPVDARGVEDVYIDNTIVPWWTLKTQAVSKGSNKQRSGQYTVSPGISMLMS